MASQLEKAVFEIYENNQSQSPKETISVLFNPSEYTISAGANYSSYKDKSGTSNLDGKKKKNYQGPKEQSLTVELFFDTSGQQFLDGSAIQESDVSKVVRKFVNMTHVLGESHTPPVVCFRWGSLQFRGYVKDITSKYVLFNQGGMPLRAQVSLSMQELPKDSEKYMEPHESPDRTKARTVTDDVSVWNIAYLEYGDPDMWRVICKANDIADPLSIPSGTVLKVPALD